MITLLPTGTASRYPPPPVGVRELPRFVPVSLNAPAEGAEISAYLLY
jgi:hypothetical protein